MFRGASINYHYHINYLDLAIKLIKMYFWQLDIHNFFKTDLRRYLPATIL